jgi:small subunit ribosomal protein MRP21
MLGRTLPVEPGNGLDLQSAFRMLEIRCSQNNVKKDSFSQATHVRKGQLRKSLKSQRWRALFLEGFLRELGRVRRMKRQGW